MKSTAWLPLLLMALASGPTYAEHAGDTVVQLGALHLQTLDHGSPLHTVITPNPLISAVLVTDFTSPGTNSSVDNSNTALLATTHYFTDHIALKVEGGLPPIFHINGAGTVQAQSPIIHNPKLLPSINLGNPSYNPIASARQWSPAMLVQYSFLDSASRWHPYVGVGVSYIWFTDLSLDPELASTLEKKFGAALAIAAGKYREGPTYVKAAASYQWSPVYNIGLSYALTPKWGVATSMSYLPLKASAHITVFAADGTQLSDSSARMNVDTLITAVLLTYRF